jgi:hypothetical protein
MGTAQKGLCFSEIRLVSGLEGVASRETLTPIRGDGASKKASVSGAFKLSARAEIFR